MLISLSTNIYYMPTTGLTKLEGKYYSLTFYDGEKRVTGKGKGRISSKLRELIKRGELEYSYPDKNFLTLKNPESLNPC